MSVPKRDKTTVYRFLLHLCFLTFFDECCLENIMEYLIGES